jgi:hypothetical protein
VKLEDKMGYKITSARVLIEEPSRWGRLLGRKPRYDYVRLIAPPAEDAATIVYVNGMLTGEFRSYP